MADSSVSPTPDLISAVFPRELPPSLVNPSIDAVRVQQQILSIVTQKLNLDDALSEIAAALGAAFRVEGCTVILSTGRNFTPQALCWSTLQDHPVKVGTNSLPWSVGELNQTKPISVSDVALLTPNTELSLEVENVLTIWRSLQLPSQSSFIVRALLRVSVSLPERGKVLFYLVRSQPYGWMQSEIEELQRLAHQAAIALSHLQLQQQLNRQLRYQAVANQVTLAIQNASEVSAILTLATDGTAQALNAKRGLLLRLKYWDPSFRQRSAELTPQVRVALGYEWLSYSQQAQGSTPHPTCLGTLETSTVNQSFWLSECSLCQRAFVEPWQPIAIEDGWNLSTTDPAGIAAVFNLEAFPAILLAPLESQGTVLGFLVFQHDQSYRWQPEDIELVKIVAAQVSTAIIQTEALRQVQALVGKRTAELRESLAVQAKLYECTRQQLDQLRYLNQLKDEFLSTVNHELRTPLTSMTLAIRMLRQQGLSEERRDRYLDILEQQCAQETGLVNDLLALQELESNQVPIQLQEFDLAIALDEVASLVQQKWTVKGLSLIVDLPQRPMRVCSDRDSFNRILLELLTNAGKYSHPDTSIRLEVQPRYRSLSEEIRVAIYNTGAGIPPTELPYVFDKFRRSPSATHNAIPGTGLGLALVKCLVQHLRGTITASSIPVQDSSVWETCFTVAIPTQLTLTDEVAV